MVQLTLILANVRSAHNVGAILRTADATGVGRVICTGITPYPAIAHDHRDPVVRNRIQRAIAKAALGAESTLRIEHFDDTRAAIADVRASACTLYGLEQAPKSTLLGALRPHFPAALIVGNEVTGLSAEVLRACDTIVEIPQRGHKESLNVSVAAGIALYVLANPAKN